MDILMLLVRLLYMSIHYIIMVFIVKFRHLIRISSVILCKFICTVTQYNSKISPDGLQYDCGVELTAQGEIGRLDYHKHAGRGTYTLHSLYLLLWANFGAFTMSLLTLPDADVKIHGKPYL